MSNQQTVIMVPAKAVRQDLITETNNIVYMPLATTQSPGVVQIGEGLNIDQNGLLSFDTNEVTILKIAKNGVLIEPDENKIVNISLNKDDVGLGNVDNTSDMNKPISIYHQQALDDKLNIYQGHTHAGQYLYVDASGNVSFKDIEKLNAYDTKGSVSDAVEWLTFSDAFNVKAEGLASIDWTAGDNLIIDLSPELKTAIYNVVYNSTTGVLTFKKADGTELKVDLPLELLIKSGYYDDSVGEIVLSLANDEEIRIPVAQLINHYYADGTTLELVALNNKLTFRIKDGAVTTNKLANSSVTDAKILTVSGSKVKGVVEEALVAHLDENGRNIATTYIKIDDSYNKTEIDAMFDNTIDISKLPVVIRMGGF